jgi:WD40 repeat protein
MRDSATGRVLWSVKGHGFGLSRCAFTRDDAGLAIASPDGCLKLRRASDGSQLHTLLIQTSLVLCVACSPAADVLLSGDFDGVVKVWDTATGAELHALPCHPHAVTSAAFDASGALAATGGFDGQIRLFDSRAGWQLLHTLEAHPPLIGMYGLQFSPAAGACAPPLASGSSDGTAKLWDVRDTRQPRLLHTLPGHDDDVNALSFSPDGALLATGSEGGTVKLWRVADGALLHTVAAHVKALRSVVFHPRDASVLATCSWDATVKLWRL